MKDGTDYLCQIEKFWRTTKVCLNIELHARKARRPTSAMVIMTREVSSKDLNNDDNMNTIKSITPSCTTAVCTLNSISKSVC